MQNLKSVALTVPEIIGVPENLGQSLDTPTLPFLQNFWLPPIISETGKATDFKFGQGPSE